MLPNFKNCTIQTIRNSTTKLNHLLIKCHSLHHSHHWKTHSKHSYNQSINSCKICNNCLPMFLPVRQIWRIFNCECLRIGHELAWELLLFSLTQVIFYLSYLALYLCDGLGVDHGCILHLLNDLAFDHRGLLELLHLLTIWLDECPHCFFQSWLRWRCKHLRSRLIVLLCLKSERILVFSIRRCPSLILLPRKIQMVPPSQIVCLRIRFVKLLSIIIESVRLFHRVLEKNWCRWTILCWVHRTRIDGTTINSESAGNIDGRIDANSVKPLGERIYLHV